MQNKLIALGAAAYGALVSWAVTADYYEQKLKEQRKYYNTYNIYNHTDASGPWSTQDVKMGVETNDSLEARLDSGEIEIVREADDTLRTRNLQTDQGERSASEAENPRGDETSEVDEAGVTEEENSVAPEETREETEDRLRNIINRYATDDDTAGQQDVGAIGADMVHEPKAPFVISRALFSSDPDEGDLYDKVTFIYYPQQRVLLDDDEEIVEDIANVVGWKNLNRFGDESSDADVVYIRNQRLNTDYEVVREENEPLPLHVKYSMPKDEFETAKAAGVLKLRPEDLID